MTQKVSRRQSQLFSRCLTTVLVFLASNSLPAHAAQGDGHWDRQFGTPGTASRNLALRFNGNSLYTGGFSVAAGQIATNTVVNVFNGTNWTSLGEITGGLTALYDFAFLGNDLYVGGLFQRAGDAPAVGLAKWYGANWSDVGGFSGLVSSLATDGTNLYVGGVFTNCGGIFTTNIAKWNGANWSALGDGIGYYADDLSQVVNVLLWHNGQLYAGARSRTPARLRPTMSPVGTAARGQRSARVWREPAVVSPAARLPRCNSLGTSCMSAGGSQPWAATCRRSTSPSGMAACGRHWARG